MSESRKWWWAVGLTIGGYLFRDSLFSTVDAGVDILADLVGSGRKLSTSILDEDNIVTNDPEQLRREAEDIIGQSVSADAYALARMVRSEAGSADLTTKVRLANVAINQARALGWSPYDVIVYHKTAARDGRYGAQISGRFASSRDPYEVDLKAALQALRGDITGGATNFAHQNAFGKQLGTASNIQPFVDTLAKEGKVPGYYPPDSNLVFFWRGGVPDDAEEGLG